MYLYRAIDSVGDVVEFWFSEQRDLPTAKRFFRKTLIVPVCGRKYRGDIVQLNAQEGVSEPQIAEDIPGCRQKPERYPRCRTGPPRAVER